MLSSGPVVANRSVRLSVSWWIAAAEARPITEALHTLMDIARSEPGCVTCSLQTRLADGAHLIYREEWQSEADLRREVRSSRFDKLLELMERASRQPRLRFHLPTAVRGLEYVAELRDPGLK